MGEASRRRALGLHGSKPNPEPLPPLQRHVLAMIDRRTEIIRHEGGAFESKFTDHSAKPNTYCSADMRTLYTWDGVSLRRLVPKP